MPNYNGSITGFVAGDNLTIKRTITQIPSGEYVTEVHFTVKDSVEDADEMALINKLVTVGSDPDGVISDDGAVSGQAVVLIALYPDETALLYSGTRGAAGFHYDIQVVTGNGLVYTPEVGTILANHQVTRDTGSGVPAPPPEGEPFTIIDE